MRCSTYSGLTICLENNDQVVVNVYSCHGLQGILNDQFSQIQTLKSVEEPENVVQLIDTYFIDVETILSELTTYMYLHIQLTLHCFSYRC